MATDSLLHRWAAPNDYRGCARASGWSRWAMHKMLLTGRILVSTIRRASGPDGPAKLVARYGSLPCGKVCGLVETFRPQEPTVLKTVHRSAAVISRWSEPSIEGTFPAVCLAGN